MSAGAGAGRVADAGGGPDPAAAFAGAHWVDVVARRVACPDLPPHVLLHAGPPLKTPPPPPLRNAAVQALIYEGMAGDEAAARRQLAAGEVLLQSAQDHGIVTPLAQVVSASMPLFVVRHHAVLAYGAVLEGPAPALRFGATDPECRERLVLLGQYLEARVAPRVRRQPVPLCALIRRAVAAGEDCHSRTSAANSALMAALESGDADPESNLLAGLSELRALAVFVLPLLMAAAAAALRHHDGDIVAVGGNGIEVGVRRRGKAGWWTAPAEAPQGERFAGQSATPALPAIGDSVVIDYCGLGGLIDAPATRARIVNPDSGIVDAARVAAGLGAPVFNLAILDAAGAGGLIGRGIYRPPQSLFTA